MCFLNHRQRHLNPAMNKFCLTVLLVLRGLIICVCSSDEPQHPGLYKDTTATSTGTCAPPNIQIFAKPQNAYCAFWRSMTFAVVTCWHCKCLLDYLPLLSIFDHRSMSAGETSMYDRGWPLQPGGSSAHPQRDGWWSGWRHWGGGECWGNQRSQEHNHKSEVSSRPNVNPAGFPHLLANEVSWNLQSNRWEKISWNRWLNILSTYTF